MNVSKKNEMFSWNEIILFDSYIHLSFVEKQIMICQIEMIS